MSRPASRPVRRLRSAFAAACVCEQVCDRVPRRHLEELAFVDVAIELCDGRPSDVERGGAQFFCPWNPSIVLIGEDERPERPMKSRLILWSGFGAVGFFGAMSGACILSLPPAAPNTAAPPIAKREADASLTALKPPKRQQPLIAIISINDATDATDYLMPYAIVRRADIADVVPLATEPGRCGCIRHSGSSRKRRSQSSMRSIRKALTMSLSRP